MRTVRLGRTELYPTVVGFGGIPIQRLNMAGAVEVIRHALDLGVTLIDTAHSYGHSEECIGRAIAGRREGLILASKAPGRDAASFREQLQTSFRRLAVDHIDLYQFHNVSKPAQLKQILAPGGAMEAAQEAKAAGRIGHIGVTSHSLEMATELVACGHFETLMFPFNFVTSEPATTLLPLCRQHDVGFIDMKPLAGGMLDDAELAFRYLSQFPDIVAIPGIERIEEIDEIVAIMTTADGLSPDERQRIAALCEELGNRFCRRCEYCQPCPEGIAISSVMNLSTFIARFPPEKLFTETRIREMSLAATCTECGTCESRCPYELSVREVVRENVARFEVLLAEYRC